MNVSGAHSTGIELLCSKSKLGEATVKHMNDSGRFSKVVSSAE